MRFKPYRFERRFQFFDFDRRFSATLSMYFVDKRGLLEQMRWAVAGIGLYDTPSTRRRMVRKIISNIRRRYSLWGRIKAFFR